MKEYIEREKVDNLIEEMAQNYKCRDSVVEGLVRGMLLETKYLVDKLPADNIIPVVNGQWINKYYHPSGDYAECSICGIENHITKFCPKCGSRNEVTT